MDHDFSNFMLGAGRQAFFLIQIRRWVQQHFEMCARDFLKGVLTRTQRLNPKLRLRLHICLNLKLNIWLFHKSSYLQRSQISLFFPGWSTKSEKGKTLPFKVLFNLSIIIPFNQQTEQVLLISSNLKSKLFLTLSRNENLLP